MTAVQVVDENPCRASLNKIFDDVLILNSPADVLLSFVDDYCINAGNDYLSSKIPYTALFHFLGL